MIIAFSIFVKRLKSDFGNMGIMVYLGQEYGFESQIYLKIDDYIKRSSTFLWECPREVP